MAKNEDNAKEQKGIADILNSKYGKNTFFYCDHKEENVTVFPTCSYTLNHCSGIGGFAKGGYIHQIYGDTGTGKTTVLLGIIANAQTILNAKCAYVDAEQRYDLTRALQIGVDPKTLLMTRKNELEETFSLICDLIESNEFPLIVLDSLNALIMESEWEQEDISKSDMGKRAKVIGNGIRKIVGSFSKVIQKLPSRELAPTLIFSNQIRASTAMFSAPEMVPGGKAIEYYSSQIVRLQAKQLIDTNGNELGSAKGTKDLDNEARGIRIVHKHQKNTFGMPHRSGSYNIFWDERVIDHADEIIAMSLSQDIIKKVSNSKYEFNDFSINGKDNMIQHFKQPAELEKLIKALDLTLLPDYKNNKIKDNYKLDIS